MTRHPDDPRHLFTAAEAERTLGIPGATTRSWARRKLLYSYGLSERNQPMYDRDELVKLRDRKVNREYDLKRKKAPKARTRSGASRLSRSRREPE